MKIPPILQLFATMCLLVLTFHGAQAQSLQPGVVKTPLKPLTCPPDFQSQQNVTCFQSTVSCPDVANVPVIDFYYALTPVPAGTRQLGTIVLLNGGDGNLIGFHDFISKYVSAGYQTIQLEWGTPAPNSMDEAWEKLGPAFTPPWSIKTAACRPAGLLNFLFHKYEFNSAAMEPVGAMCAQGTSAGAAAVAYSMTDYGAADYLDMVEFISGPTLSDVAAGCDPPFQSVNVCNGRACDTGGEGGWLNSAKYNFAALAVDGWTGIASSNPNACTKGSGLHSNWKNLSIDYPPGNPTFSYPRTSMSGWLCSNKNVQRCVGNTCEPCTSGCQNNSAAQGQLFFSKVTSPLTVYRVDACNGPEGVDMGTVPALSETGLVAIQNDMIGTATSAPMCKMRH